MNTDIAQLIHDASLDLLENPGVKIEHAEIAKLLLDNGAKPGADADVICFPRPLVMESLAKCPNAVGLADHAGNIYEMTSTSEPTFWPVPSLNIDIDGVHRPNTSDDLAKMTRLYDQLPHVDAAFGTPVEDVVAAGRDVVGLSIMAQNTTKHIRVLSFTGPGGARLAEMKHVVGDYPWFSVGFTAHGPLRWTELALEIFKTTAGHKIPASINGEPMAGVSGPVTLAGSAAVGNAEILSGLVINQLLEEGRPCIYNLGLAHVFDMRMALVVTGGPENHLFAEISALMGRFYSLPSASWVSTESMCVDAQAAMEKMAGFTTHVAGGVSNLWGVAQLESELTISPAMAVIDDEMIGYVKRLKQGVKVSDKTLALDVTREVGVAGSFLEHDHTLMNYRDELYMPRLGYRGTREQWTAADRLTMTQRAEAKAKQLMETEVDCGLSDDQVRELDRLADEFVAGL